MRRKRQLVGLKRECVFIEDGRLFLPHAFCDTLENLHLHFVFLGNSIAFLIFSLIVCFIFMLFMRFQCMNRIFLL